MSFLLVYAVLSKRSFRVAFLAALLVWASLSLITALLNFRNQFFSVGVFLSVASFYFYMLKMKMKLHHVGGSGDGLFSSSSSVQSDCCWKHHRPRGALESARRTPARWHRIVVPGNIQPHSLFRLPNPWNGVVASVNETIVDIRWTKPHFRIAFSSDISALS